MRTAPGTAPRRQAIENVMRFGLPIAVLLSAIGLWEWVVWWRRIPPYILPAPSAILTTLIRDWNVLSGSLLVTLRITFSALLAATIGGVLLALLFAQSRWIERAFFPFAVILQVTPVVAIAPLLLIYLEPSTAVLVVAFIVAFFPILSNTALGLASADHNLRNLFDLYGASRWQQLIHLRLPSALPYFLGGLRIGGGLALIGAIVAEIAAGSAGQGSGLAFRIVESGYRLNIPRMFAALLLISFAGVLIFVTLNAISHFALRRWHESVIAREN
jgi:NitT/TauT family transport system permease protein